MYCFKYWYTRKRKLYKQLSDDHSCIVFLVHKKNNNLLYGSMLNYILSFHVKLYLVVPWSHFKLYLIGIYLDFRSAEKSYICSEAF